MTVSEGFDLVVVVELGEEKVDGRRPMLSWESEEAVTSIVVPSTVAESLLVLVVLADLALNSPFTIVCPSSSEEDDIPLNSGNTGGPPPPPPTEVVPDAADETDALPAWYCLEAALGEGGPVATREGGAGNW